MCNCNEKLFYASYNNCKVVTVQEHKAVNVLTITLTFIFTETKILMSFPNIWRGWLTCISSLETSVFSFLFFF